MAWGSVMAARCVFRGGGNAPRRSWDGSLSARPVAMPYRKTCPQFCRARWAVSKAPRSSIRRKTASRSGAVISAMGLPPARGRHPAQAGEGCAPRGRIPRWRNTSCTTRGPRLRSCSPPGPPAWPWRSSGVRRGRYLPPAAGGLRPAAHGPPPGPRPGNRLAQGCSGRPPGGCTGSASVSNRPGSPAGKAPARPICGRRHPSASRCGTWFPVSGWLAWA